MEITKYPFLRDGEEKLFTQDILDEAVLLKAQNRHIPIKCDVGFKLLLARDTKASQACLRAILGDLTGRTVAQATVTNAELLPDLIGSKKPRMDINCVFDGGQRADIELQLSSQMDDQRLRSLYYASRLYSGSIREGEFYKHARNVYQIFLTDYDPFHDGTFHHRAMMRLDNGSLFSDRLQIRFYNLKVPGFKALDDIPEDLKRAVFWCKFISDGIGSTELARFARHNGMSEELEMAEQAYKEITVTEEERAWAYHLSMDRAEVDYRNELLLGMEEAREKGLKEGREEGRKEGRKEGLAKGQEESKISTARNLLAMKVLSHEQISKAVGLTLNKIEELASEL